MNQMFTKKLTYLKELFKAVCNISIDLKTNVKTK